MKKRIKTALWWFRQYWRICLESHDPKATALAPRIFSRYFTCWIRTPFLSIGYQRCYPVASAMGLWTGWNFSFWPSCLFLGFSKTSTMYVWTWTTRKIELSEPEIQGLLREHNVFP